MKMAFIGPPGIAKGTHAKRLAKETHRPHISTGDMFRNAIVAETKEGELAPCDKVIARVMDRISQDDCEEGYYLEGFPRILN